MIQVSCAQCQKSFNVAEQHAGKSGRCPTCKTVIAIPKAAAIEAIVVEDVLNNAVDWELQAPAKAAATPSPTTKAPAVSPEQILGAFQGKIEPVHTSLSYKLGVTLVSLVMLVLPLVYLSLIALVGYAVYWHLAHDHAMLQVSGSGKAKAAAFVIYIAPVFMGATLIFFMIKPLFAPAGKRPGTRSLTRDGEPLLFAFVDRICEAVGSARPSRIDVDCEVNASASFRNGWLSMITNDLVLTIGVPLAAGMNMRQFAGVLAHEFGHFSQGAGMRLSYLVRSINAWFQRVVYDRDSWDEWLDETARSTDFRFAIFLWATMLCIWLTRKVLWVLMIIGHGTSSFFMREMEFDADRYEARLSGSATYATTQKQLLTLGFANQAAQGDLQDFWREGRLGDCLPKLIVARAAQFTPQQLASIDKIIAEEKTLWHSTHPAGHERIANAAREQAPGIFQLELPATQLFANFDALSKNVTWDFYRAIFGQQFARSDMHDTELLLAQLNRNQQNNEALERYFQRCFTFLRPLPLPSATPRAPVAPQRTLEKLKQARLNMLAEAVNYSAMLKDYDLADTRLMEAKQALEMLHAHITPRAHDFQFPVSSTTAALRAREEAQTTQGRFDGKMKPFEEALTDRLVSALELVHVPQVTARIAHSQNLPQEVTHCYEAFIAILPHWKAMFQLRNERAALGALCGQLEHHRNSEALVDSIKRSMRECYRLINETRSDLQRIPYPYEHAQGEVTVAVYCVKQMPTSDDLGGIFHAAEGLLDGLLPLCVRLLAQLVAIAEQVETAVGLPRLEAPPKEPAEAS